MDKFDALLKSFLGFLVGTQKSLLTVSSYRGDLLVLRDFLRENKKDFFTLKAIDLEAYQHYLQRRGLKTNTRRRKMIAAKALFRYAWQRKKIAQSPAQFLKTPPRREVLPWIPTRGEVKKILALTSSRSLLGRRNRLLLQVLSETGISISELCAIRWEDIADRTIRITGKKARELRISSPLAKELAGWRRLVKGDFLFPGFYRHGFFTARMTPRGVELSVKELAKKAELPHFQPKSFRHFATLHWIDQGIEEGEILRRLGVRKAYPLELYRNYLKNLASPP